MAKTAARPTGRDVYTPVDTFTADVDGVDTLFRAGETLVREGHPILDRFPNLFQPVRVHYDVEQATAAPGEVRS